MALNFLNNGYFAGKVGIGIQSPAAKLHVNPTTTDEIAIAINGTQNYSAGEFQRIAAGDASSINRLSIGFGYDSPTDWAIRYSSYGRHEFYTGNDWGNAANTEKMVITSSGSVGIGTGSPGTKLEVVADVAKGVLINRTYTTSSQSLANVRAYYGLAITPLRGGTGGLYFTNYDADTPIIQSVNTSDVAQFLLLNPLGGNVGIGTTSPGYKLDVNGVINVSDNNPIRSSNEIMIRRTNSTNLLRIGSGDTSDETQFYAGGSERMRLSSAGNLGINTTNPVYKLDVNGDARSTHFRDGTKGSGSTPATIGWYKVASWTGGSARGGSEIKLSTTGGNFTPITWIIRCYKNWSGDATLKLEQYGYSNIYFTKARVEYDNTAAVYYLEIYQSIATALSFNMYQTSLMGYDSNVSILTGALAAGTTGGTTRTELPFIAGGTSVEALTIGNSGNTGPYLPLAGGIMTGNTVHNDNVKSIYGTASDGLEIYHDGTDSIIADTGTGDLYIRGAASMRLQGINQSNFFIANQGGSVNLYYNNANKFDTTNTGINVTGDIRLNTKALLSNQENTDVDTGTETVAQVAIATYTAAFFDFVIKKTTNVRSGTVYACHDGTNVEFTETSTQDLGDTSDVTLSVDISGGNMRLLATVTSDDWSVKSLIRAI